MPEIKEMEEQRNNSMPLVSVIIPTYNVERYIEECLDSILNQNYPNIEIIVCDDCSTDNTWNILGNYKDYEQILLLRNDSNLKQARTRNNCIDYAKGDYILIQDADDISEADRVVKLLDSFEEDIDFVGSACFCFNENIGKYEELRVKTEYPQKKDLLVGIPFVHASILFKKDCLKAVDGYRYSKHTSRGEDYDLILRLYAAGFRGKNIQDLLYGYRVDLSTVERRNMASRVDECFIRYNGFKANHILFPSGWLYALKPLPAYFYQYIKHRKLITSK